MLSLSHTMLSVLVVDAGVWQAISASTNSLYTATDEVVALNKVRGPRDPFNGEG